MNLAIDQGNSSTKLGFFDKGKLIATYKLVFLDKKVISELIKRYRPNNIILSSVTDQTKELEQISGNIPGQFLVFDHLTPIPVKNGYKTPETLGKDRLAAVIGAAAIYPDIPLLVIDAGTAITFDLYHDHVYYGGNISPGLKMRFAALHQQTSRLPETTTGDTPFWGKTTEEAIRSGVQNSLLMEFEGYIKKVKKQYPDAKTVLTGGDADFFVSYTKSIIFAQPNLVLSGLNRIIEYNA
ncbi:type III pantothenate kinase [Marinilabilia salmonicolor]|uniref:type III pantothenate kinase n=1 Tax=Marinilabilia salmonicolor TaxID=989 RepID=UPI00029A95A6|nr:type III pantothenate kinase [Marinilabilia salmonicolor]